MWLASYIRTIYELFEIELFEHLNCVLMLISIVLNRTIYMFKFSFGIE